jgi:beta-xylosidase
MLRRALLVVALIVAPGVVRAQSQATYTNPILYADYSDPDVIRVGNDYYMVASSFHFSPGIPVLRSRDLVHWSIIGHVLPRLPFGLAYDLPGPHTLTDAISRPVGPGARHAGGVWAPTIRHHEGLFYVYWATPDEGVFMSTAQRPEGPWTIPTTLIQGPGYEDPGPFWDDDGQAWLIHSRVGAGPLILHRMSPDGRRVLDEGETIVEDRVNLPVLEGPKLYKRNGWYYIFAPIGGVERGSQAVGRARSLRGPYEWRTVLEPGATAIQGPHQGGWVETPSGQGWFAHFNSTGAFGRIVHLQPLRWVDDWPLIGEPIPGRVSGQPVPVHAMPDTGSPPTGDRLQDSDEFAGRALGLQWSWNHNPVNTAWSLSRRPGWLRLAALPSDHLVTARKHAHPDPPGSAHDDLNADRRAQHGRGPARRPRHVRRSPELDRRGAQWWSQPRHPRRGGRGDRRPRADAPNCRAPRRSRPRPDRALCLQPRRRPHLPALGRSDPARPLFVVEGLAAVAVQLHSASEGRCGAAGLDRRGLVPG